MQTAAKPDRLSRSLAAPFLAVNRGVFVFIAAIVAGALVSAYWISASTSVAPIISIATRAVAQTAARSPEPAPSSARFASLGANRTPSEPAGVSPLPQRQPPAPACPAYFRWIHEDLRPWRVTGITRETLDGAHRYGPKFRVTVIAGRLYVARYGRCFQTRDVFTQWGILQLLRRHAGRVPDLDLMFDCQDLPVVNAGDHAPPPLFRYCGSETTLDIAFPDWSFWGWPELNIKPWDALRREIGEGNAALHWTRRTPYAYWKGNPTVGTVRWELLKCNVSRERDWNAQIYAQLQASLPAAAAIPAAAAALRYQTQHPKPSPQSPSREPRAPPAAYSVSCPTPSRRPNISHAAKAPESSQTLALALSSSSSCRSSPDAPPATNTAAAPSSSNSSCPSYFRFIHEDLRPWRAAGGVTRAMLARARVTASFRLVVLRGRAYVQRFRPAFQTRDLFTIWGILQLLRRYPGRVPDLDLMFDCVDWPVVRTHLYRGKHAPFMPPLFRYCGDDRTLDIVFPDWSFWGWPEINIKPWDALQKDLKIGNNRVTWSDREPYAYWKGNTAVAVSRQELVKCNISSTQDWNARIYTQDWFKESKAGYRNSNLGNQCTHRYKIYVEGSAWSISQKYILACDSMTLLVTPKYYDFFSRSLMPIQHYWPVRDDNKCASIKYAVEWGNSHKQSAQRIGKEASNFIQEEVNMDLVYDYMLHLLTEYAKLLRFRPTKPPEAVEVCPESLICQAEGIEKKFLTESMVKSAHDSGPCDLPPPFSPLELRMLKQRKENTIRQVEMWERIASAA